MEIFYFTALIPASNLEMKIKRLQQDSSLYIPLPPLAPLEIHKELIPKKKYNKNIDIITEFRTDRLTESNGWCLIKLQSKKLEDIYPPLNCYLFPKNKFSILVGLGVKNNLKNDYLGEDVIRNWSLGFFEIRIWDKSNPMENIELIKHWEIRKKKLKQSIVEK